MVSTWTYPNYLWRCHRTIRQMQNSNSIIKIEINCVNCDRRKSVVSIRSICPWCEWGNSDGHDSSVAASRRVRLLFIYTFVQVIIENARVRIRTCVCVHCVYVLECCCWLCVVSMRTREIQKNCNSLFILDVLSSSASSLRLLLLLAMRIILFCELKQDKSGWDNINTNKHQNTLICSAKNEIFCRSSSCIRVRNARDKRDHTQIWNSITRQSIEPIRLRSRIWLHTERSEVTPVSLT